LEYEGYKVSKEYDAEARKSKVVIRKGVKVLAVNGDGEGFRDSSCFGLYPVLGGGKQQLITVQTSGGVHCCFSYRIYDLVPKFRLLFDDGNYPIGDGFDELEFKDIDGDGVQEFTQRNMTFHYWEELAYVSSPQPEIVFRYDPWDKRFHPANKRFAAYLLEGVEDDIRGLDPNDPAQNWVGGLDITLRYIYAGEERKAWKFYDRTFGPKFYEKDTMKTKLKRTLMGDRVYRSLYRR
jgi:hypothetical protein